MARVAHGYLLFSAFFPILLHLQRWPCKFWHCHQSTLNKSGCYPIRILRRARTWWSHSPAKFWRCCRWIRPCLSILLLLYGRVCFHGMHPLTWMSETYCFCNCSKAETPSHDNRSSSYLIEQSRQIFHHNFGQLVFYKKKIKIWSYLNARYCAHNNVLISASGSIVIKCSLADMANASR